MLHTQVYIKGNGSKNVHRFVGNTSAVGKLGINQECLHSSISKAASYDFDMNVRD